MLASSLSRLSASPTSYSSASVPVGLPHGAPQGSFSVAGPIVRIHLPPAVSQANFRIAPLARRDSASGFDLDQDACELVQFRPAVVAPRGEARADIDIVFDLAGRFTRSVSWSDLLTQARLYKAPMVSLIVASRITRNAGW